MNELIEQFVIEARELVQQASEDLLMLENQPGDRERLESAFRAVHTLKGSVGLFDLGPMLDVLHRAEDLLSRARSGEIAVDAALIDPLMAVIDWVDDSLGGIEGNAGLSDIHRQQAVRLIGILAPGIAAPAATVPTLVPVPTEMPSWAASLDADIRSAGISGRLTLIHYEPHPECFFNGDDPFATMARLADIRHMAFRLREPADAQSQYDPFRCNLVIEAAAADAFSDIEAIFRMIPDQVSLIATGDDATETAVADPAHGAERLSPVMRVETARIDALVEIASELVTAKNTLAPLVEEARSRGEEMLARRIASNHHEIERLVASLHGAVTRARMIPLEATFRRFPRLVRETSARLGKGVDLVIEGEGVEADREIVESLFEPLLHIIRNALDHGVETEAERVAARKPARGRIGLRTRQRGERIEIEVEDDGRGMDPDRVARTAVARGLISPEQLSSLPAEAVLQLVFTPGFSTAAAVSDLSGRGVGLDVVRTAIERLGGSVGLSSVTGSGTRFVLRLPISFSMAELMVVEVGGERYGIPMSEILETCRLPLKDVQPVRAGRAFVLRNSTIPLVDLSDMLKHPQRKSPPSAGDLKVLILRHGGERIGVVVDTITERAETLTRPMAGLLQGVMGVAGTTLLGDGKVLLVLNIEELIA
ncbi:chemotaxis protein CheA [Neorhizobium sp. NPDC001467]|uniref:chemotaxis protein CheA n=1 Tax=Neorhizobium sp. NPDC001467 TaxID=3390595 RepID=UPI003D065D8E